MILEIFTNPMYGKALWETVYMTFIASFFAYIFGLIIAAFLYFSKRSKRTVVKTVGQIVGWIINIGRSIPFLILVMLLMDVTRVIVGTVIGSTATIVPLVIGSTPLVTRMLESSFEEISSGKIETAISMGADNFHILFKVLIPESLPSIIRGMSISSISILGYTAMAGALGGGGLGQIAMSYGYQRYRTDVLIITLIFLIVLVQIIQSVFNLLANAIDKR